MTNHPGLRGFLSGRRRRLYIGLFIAAVAIGAVAFAVWLFFFVGNGRDTSRAGVSVIQARLIAPDKLRLNVNSCNKNAGVSDLVETDVDVQVKVVADYDPSPLFVQECDDAVEVQLAKPLGDRDVVDKHTGEVVRDASRYLEMSVVEARLIAPNEVMLNVSSCNRNPNRSPGVSDLVETDVDVQVRVVAEFHPPLQGRVDCRDRWVRIQLQQPLGDRDVIDKRSGEVVRVHRDQAQKARDDVADLPDVPAPKIGDAPSEAELDDLQFIADQESISLQTAIERYGWRDNFSLAVKQIQEAVSVAFVGAEIVDDSNAWIAFKGAPPVAALEIINTFKSSHSGVSVQIRTGKGWAEEELNKAIPAVHYAVYRDPEVRDATTYFDRDTSQIRTTVVLDAAASDSAIERLKAFAETKLIEATRADILNSISVVVVRSERDVLGGTEGNR